MRYQNALRVRERRAAAKAEAQAQAQAKQETADTPVRSKRPRIQIQKYQDKFNEIHSAMRIDIEKQK